MWNEKFCEAAKQELCDIYENPEQHTLQTSQLKAIVSHREMGRDASFQVSFANNQLQLRPLLSSLFLNLFVRFCHAGCLPKANTYICKSKSGGHSEEDVDKVEKGQRSKACRSSY
jgi:hypothetical protein